MAKEKFGSDNPSDLVHEIIYYVDPARNIPAQEFLQMAPKKVFSLMTTVAAAVAEAPPKRFSGGGYWETMKGSMAGWFEIRVDGPGKKLHYRLFCVLDYWAIGIDGPLLVLVAGLVKPIDTVFTEKQYALIREMSKEYFGNNPRRK